MPDSLLIRRCLDFSKHVQKYKESGLYPYFRAIAATSGTTVEVAGRELIMISSNDYLGLTHDPEVIAGTTEIINRFGTGTGGSRFLCGNMDLHRQLEAELAAFVGKKQALVFATGFSTNLGAIVSLLRRNDIVLFDKEGHASIFDACRMSGARILPFAHNDAADAEKKLQKQLNCRENSDNGIILLVTEGVFSMSGAVVDLPSFIRLKEKYPNFHIYLDDAHGLGTMGEAGRGVADYYGMEEKVDLIMGTFSKSLASIGGFIACDDANLAEYLQHKSRTMIFSAALPAGNVATVLACLAIIRSQPDRLKKLWRNLRRVREGYERLGLAFGKHQSPVIPVFIGDEERAFAISRELFDNDIFALPVVAPAVGQGQAIIRTSFMSTHSFAQLDYFLETIGRIFKTHRLIE